MKEKGNILITHTFLRKQVTYTSPLSTGVRFGGHYGLTVATFILSFVHILSSLCNEKTSQMTYMKKKYGTPTNSAQEH